MLLLIVGLSQLGSFFREGFSAIVTEIISEIEEMVVIVGVPLLLGLAWNRWAGGASGFLLGSLYSIWWSVKYGVFSRGLSMGLAQHCWAGFLALC